MADESSTMSNGAKLGNAMGALGDLFDGLTSLTASKTKASALRRAGAQAAMEAGANSEQILRDGSYLEGQAAANAAATGGGFQGSTLNVLSDMARKISMNARQTITNGRNDTLQANYQAKVATQQGWLDFGAGVVKAAAKAAVLF